MGPRGESSLFQIERGRGGIALDLNGSLEDRAQSSKGAETAQLADETQAILFWAVFQSSNIRHA